MKKKVVIGKGGISREPDKCPHHSGLEMGQVNVIRWQRRQNGDMRDLRKEVKEMRDEYRKESTAQKRWIIATLVSVVLLLITALIAAWFTIAGSMNAAAMIGWCLI